MEEPKFEEVYGRVVTLIRALPPHRQKLLHRQVGECLFGDPDNPNSEGAARAHAIFRSRETEAFEANQRESFQRLGIDPTMD